MFSQPLVFEGALHLCFAVSERASEIPYVHVVLMFVLIEVLTFEAYYYCSLVDYAIDMSLP